MNHLRVVLQVLMENQLFSKYSKCEFWLRLMTFLCNMISSEGVDVDLRKTEAVKNSLRLLTATGIRSFLGLVGYYRTFVAVFASIESLFIKLTQKSVNLEWSEACERNFHIFKDRLTSTALLTLPEGTKGIV